MIRFLRVAAHLALTSPESVTEHVIAEQVFERGGDFSSRSSSIVRVEARRLRRKLSEYYNREGRTDPVGVELAKGSYVPMFWIRFQGGARAAGIHPLSAFLRPGQRLAILPITAMSPGQQCARFCAGLREELINAFTKLLQMRVAAPGPTIRSSHERDIQDLGKRLSAALVLEGSVRQHGPRMRIAIRFAGTEDGLTIWSETYDRKSENFLAVQIEVAKRVVADATGRKPSLPL